MARVEPDPSLPNLGWLRLIARMGWRHWFPTAAEQAARADRAAGRAELGARQRRAAAAFRWRLLHQPSDPVAKDWTDGGR